MPPKGWKSVKLESALMAATEWKRRFFEEAEYESVLSLVQAAARGGMATPYVEAFLALGHRKRKRHSIADVLLGLQEHPTPKWVTRVSSGLWLVYSTERNMWKDSADAESTDLAQSSRRQRELICGTGLVNKRRPSLKGRAQKARLEGTTLMAGSFCRQFSIAV